MCVTSVSKPTEKCLNGQFKNSLQKILISTFSDLKSMNDDTQIWIMTTQLVVEDSPSYRPGCVTNGRVWQPPGITGIKVTAIKLTGDAARSQSSSSLPGRRIRNWGLLCITLWWEQCACRFGHLDSDSWREMGISSPKLKKKKQLEKKKIIFYELFSMSGLFLGQKFHVYWIAMNLWPTDLLEANRPLQTYLTRLLKL